MELPVVQGSPEWLELRKNYVTATDAAEYLTTHVSLRSLLVRKKLNPPSIPPRLRALMDWGKEHEKDAAAAFSEYLDTLSVPHHLFCTGLHVHANGWLAASLDRLIKFESQGKRLTLVELKCTHLAQDRLPVEKHKLQVRTQLEVLHSFRNELEKKFEAELQEFGYLVYWNTTGFLRVYTVRKEQDFPYESLRSFWCEIDAARQKGSVSASE